MAFDVFRFDDGLIVEHWDNLQDIAEPNPSGRTQLDGPTEVSDRELTEDNRQRVRDFVEQILMGGQWDKLPRFYAADIAQHNTMVADGLDGLAQAVQWMNDNGIAIVYDSLHHVWAEGNFVLTVSEGAFGGKPTALYDLFRVEDGMIVEHWDVLETLDDRASGDPGKF